GGGLTGRGVEEIDFGARTRRGQPLPVRTERQSSGDVRHRLKGPDKVLAGLESPDSHRSVPADRGDPIPFRALLDVQEWKTGFELEWGAGLLAGGDVPDPHKAVPVGRGDLVAVDRVEGDAGHRVGVADEPPEGLTGRRIPERECLIQAGRDHGLAVAAELD